MKWLLIAMLSSNMFDIMTTEYSLHTYPNMIHEANPLMTNTPVRLALKIPAPFIIYGLTKKWNGPTWAKVVICISATSMWTYLGYRNMGVINKARRMR